MELKQAYDRWKHADTEWVDATLDLAKQLAEEKERHPDTKEFGIWLEKNEIVFSRDDRAALIGIGTHLDIAEPFIRETNRRSVRLVWLELKKRVRSAAKSVPGKSKKASKKTEQKTFARHLLAGIRRKRKEANDVPITTRWRPEAVNKLALIRLLDEVEHWLDDFINNRAVSFDNRATNAERKLEGVSNVKEDERRVSGFDA